jgi:glycosyltransferase involved in cell wall biosynthesis
LSGRGHLGHRCGVSESRVLLWMPLPPPYAGPEIASQLLAEAIKVHLDGVRVENASLRTVNMHKGRLDVRGVVAFLKAYRRFVKAARGVDTVYLVAAANTVGCLRDAALVATARILGREVVFHMHGGRYRDYYAGSNALMKRVLAFSWGSARNVIVQAPRLTDALCQAAPHVETVVLPNGLAAESFVPKQSYKTAAPRLLFVGHLTYFKGFYDLMKAFRALRTGHPDATLVCAGELPRPERSFADFLPTHLQAEYVRRRFEICDEIREFISGGAANGVEYAGIVDGDRKATMFRNADVLVLPSYTEGFSLAILEAMFYGLPVVSTRVGGTPDIIKAENGILVDPGDIEALGSALEALITDPARRETIGRNNAREARERYDIRLVALELARILRGRASAGRRTHEPTARGS